MYKSQQSYKFHFKGSEYNMKYCFAIVTTTQDPPEAPYCSQVQHKTTQNINKKKQKNLKNKHRRNKLVEYSTFAPYFHRVNCAITG